MLICTDLMARGIDFKGVNCVLNYDFPQSVVSYIHRYAGVDAQRLSLVSLGASDCHSFVLDLRSC